MPLDCTHITSVKRHLAKNSNLLLGDQITGGSATKTSAGGGAGGGAGGAGGAAGGGSGTSDADLEINQVAAEIYGIDLTMEQMHPVGTTLSTGDFITEDGFTADEPDGVDVIHQGFGGEARVFAPGTHLNEGDLVINGKVIDGDGKSHYAPYQVSDDSSSVSSDGAVVSPGGAADDDVYCSLDELAGKPPKDQTRLEDWLDEIDLELDLPGLDFTWWVPIQQKINELMQLTGKFIAKTQNLVSLVDLDPDEACKYLPDVSKLIEIMQKVLAAINRINAIMAKISKLIKKLKKALKLILWLFAPLRAVQVMLQAMQMIYGIPILLELAVKNMFDASKILPQLISLLQKIIAQCAMNRGMEAGLSKEECEALGGVYVDRRPGDLGNVYDATGTGGDGTGDGTGGDGTGGGTGGGTPNLDANIDPNLGFGDEGVDYFPPLMPLNPGDDLTSGNAEGPGGEILNAPATIPFDAGDGDWSMDNSGGTGNSDNADINEDEIEAMLDSQILDMSECLTDLDDYLKTANFSN